MRLKNFGFTMLLGDLTADPLFFLTSAGTPKLTFRLAVDRLAPDTLERPNGGAQTDFFQLVALGPQWGDLDLVRGDRVLVLTKPRSEDITTQEG
ncbi:MAG: hypothetical protein U9Q70_10995, partial [Chloroflexota bacterium]|nr:hypothetical protein [Chloroflexota bacterium]